MTTNHREYFRDFEVEHHHTTYYAHGYVAYSIEQQLGGNYQGHDYEVLYHREIGHIHLSDLWYLHPNTNRVVELIGNSRVGNIVGGIVDKRDGNRDGKIVDKLVDKLVDKRVDNRVGNIDVNLANTTTHNHIQAIVEDAIRYAYQ